MTSRQFHRWKLVTTAFTKASAKTSGYEESFLTFKGNVLPRIGMVTSGLTNRITPTLINAKGSSSFLFCPFFFEPLDQKWVDISSLFFAA